MRAATRVWCAVTVGRLGQALGRGGGGQFLHALLHAQAPPAQLVDGATHRVQVQPCAVERQVGDQGPLEGLMPAVGFPGGRAGRPQEVPRQRGGAGAPVAPFVPGGRGVGSRSAQARHVRAAGRVAVERDAPVGHRSAHGIGAWRTVSTGPDGAPEGTSLAGVRVGAGGGVVGVPSVTPPQPGEETRRQEEGEDSDPVRQGAAGRAALLPSSWVGSSTNMPGIAARCPTDVGRNGLEPPRGELGRVPELRGMDAGGQPSHPGA